MTKPESKERTAGQMTRRIEFLNKRIARDREEFEAAHRAVDCRTERLKNLTGIQAGERT